MAANIYNKNDKLSLVSNQTRKKIFRNVLIVHVSLIFLILVWGFMVELFKPRRPKVITVSLYNPPSNPGPPAYTPPPVTPPKKTVKQRPTPRKKTVNKQTKRTVKKRIVKKSKPRKKWKPAKKIEVSREVVYVKPETPVKQPQTISKQKLLKYLNQNRVKIRSSVRSSGMTQSYENSVGAYLYQHWKTPDKSILGGKRPEVKISLYIAASGRLLNAQILSASGIAAMDSSVKKLLNSLKYLPAPNNGSRRITLILEVIE
jgi:TonB family protein